MFSFCCSLRLVILVVVVGEEAEVEGEAVVEGEMRSGKERLFIKSQKLNLALLL